MISNFMASKHDNLQNIDFFAIIVINTVIYVRKYKTKHQMKYKFIMRNKDKYVLRLF
jgi:hypothetical protein